MSSWTQTFTGRKFWPLNPSAEDICIEDIAHALSMLCRYGGHCIRFYSVAEHCCHMHDFAKPEHKAWALMHDASEAYLVDVPRPIKPYLGGYKEMESRVMAAVCERFGLPPTEPPEVKEIDNRILADEAAQNMRDMPESWLYDPLGITLKLWSPRKAKMQFLKRAAVCLAPVGRT